MKKWLIRLWAFACFTTVAYFVASCLVGAGLSAMASGLVLAFLAGVRPSKESLDAYSKAKY